MTIRKAILLFLFQVLFINLLSAQQGKTEQVHQIVFQLTSGDSLAHKQLMKQCNNILSVAPSTKIEVVCHGPGLDMLVQEKSLVADKIEALNKRGVAFLACEFSIRERKVDRNSILKSAGFVEAGIIEIVSKQEQGWSYIKAGF